MPKNYGQFIKNGVVATADTPRRRVELVFGGWAELKPEPKKTARPAADDKPAKAKAKDTDTDTDTGRAGGRARSK